MSAEWLLDKIQDENPKASYLTLEMVEFGKPLPYVSATYNTQVDVIAKPGYRIKNRTKVIYNRWGLSTLGMGLILNSSQDITVEMVLGKLNPLGKEILTLEDLEPFTIPPLRVGESTTLNLKAKETSYAWVGSLDVTLYRSDGTSSLEETVLAGLVDLQKKFAKLSAGVVVSIEGHDGVLTLADIGLENVDNTRDIDKPVSIPQQAALDLKLDKKDVYREIVNGSTDNFYKGQVIAFRDDGTCALAQLKDAKLCFIAGVVMDEVIFSGGGKGRMTSIGIITADADVWFKATGEVGGLVQGTAYFLSQQRGMLTSNPDLSPVTAGRLCAVGRAVSNTDFMISIENPIEL